MQHNFNKMYKNFNNPLTFSGNTERRQVFNKKHANDFNFFIAHKRINIEGTNKRIKSINIDSSA